MPVSGKEGKQSHVLAPARTRRVVSEWSDWYVYRIDGPPMGPLSAKAVADAILAGTLPPDCWVCAPGGSRWLRATSVPVIANSVAAGMRRRRLLRLGTCALAGVVAAYLISIRLLV